MEVATAFIILQYHQSLNFEYQQYVYISASVYITTSWPQIVPSHQQISNWLFPNCGTEAKEIMQY
jgi:hypothetical protein